jgi:hypothetical protein
VTVVLVLPPPHLLRLPLVVFLVVLVLIVLELTIVRRIERVAVADSASEGC